MSALRSIVFGLSLGCAVMVGAARVDAYLFSQPVVQEQQADIFFRMLGTMREVLSGVFILKSDEYFHGGTEHPEGEEHHVADEMYEPPEQSGSAQEQLPGVRSADPLTRLQTAVRELPVRHVRGAEQAEVLPWFAAAAAADRHNVQAYVLGGFWLSDRLLDPDRAVQFLQEGLRWNPDSWQIQEQIGEIYFTRKKDYVRAVVYLKQALANLSGTAGRIDRSRVLTFLEAGYEKLGDYRSAAVYLEQLVRVNPEDQQLKQRLRDLSE